MVESIGSRRESQTGHDHRKERKRKMKVTLQKDYRKYYTLDDLDRAKMVIAAEKEDEETAIGWAEYAVNEALKNTHDYCRRILEVSARTAKNCRAYNAYGEGTEDMDVWIEGIAKTADGFLEFGAYLSDIWQHGAVEYKHHMYFCRYTKAN